MRADGCPHARIRDELIMHGTPPWMRRYAMFLNDLELCVAGSLSCRKTHLQQVFVEVDGGQRVKEDFNIKRLLTRQEFLQILVHIAVLRYLRPRKPGAPPLCTEVSVALTTLLDEQIVPRLDPAALQVSNEFRQVYLYLPEMDEVLGTHLETLTNLFDVYANAFPLMSNSGMANSTRLSFGERCRPLHVHARVHPSACLRPCRPPRPALCRAELS